MKYMKRPIVIEAYQFTGNTWSPGWTARWITCPFVFEKDSEECTVALDTSKGRIKVLKGEWIIKEDNGEFHVCDSLTFDTNYIEHEAD